MELIWILTAAIVSPGFVHEQASISAANKTNEVTVRLRKGSAVPA